MTLRDEQKPEPLWSIRLVGRSERFSSRPHRCRRPLLPPRGGAPTAVTQHISQPYAAAAAKATS